MIAVSSVTLGRPFCCALYLFWSSPTPQPFHIASKCALLYLFILRRKQWEIQQAHNPSVKCTISAVEGCVFLIFWRIEVVYHHSADVMLFWTRLVPSISIFQKNSLKKCSIHFSSQQTVWKDWTELRMLKIHFPSLNLNSLKMHRNVHTFPKKT